MQAASTLHARAEPAGERIFQPTLSAALAALGFFLPWSTAGTSLSLIVLLVLGIGAAGRLVRLRPWQQPVLVVGIVLMAWIVLRTLVEGPGPRTLVAINRYHELMMIPLLWVLMRSARAPQSFFHGLMAGALAFALVHWMAPLVPALNPWLTHRRISAGFGLAVCAFLLYEHARLGLVPRWPGIAGAVFLAFTVVFATDGRTGVLVLLLMLACAAWRTAPRRWRWAAACVLVIAGVGLTALSEPMRERISETIAAAHSPSTRSDGELTSTDIRVQLVRTGATVARENFLLGTGWAGYPNAFARASAELGAPAGPWSSADNPHDEYLLQLGAGGLPALALFLAWLAAPLVRVRGRSGPWASALACVTVAFAFGCLFNSLLLDFVEGHLYGAILAWLLARRETA
jgi:O-antigen ligase